MGRPPRARGWSLLASRHWILTQSREGDLYFHLHVRDAETLWD